MRHLLKLQDLNSKELLDIIGLADRLKYERRHGIPHELLRGKTLGMIFQKSSTRTRVSFEAGIYQLGGMGLFLSSSDLQIGRGEPVKDTARVLSRYIDGVMIRTFAQSEVETFAGYSSVPVINGLTDYAHPCQVLGDLMTVREFKSGLAGLKMCFIGDGNNVANSLIAGAALAGIEMRIGCPKGYGPDADVVRWAESAGGRVVITEDIFEAAADADAVYTDVWASMGQEKEGEQRKAAFSGYCVDARLMSAAKKDAILLHCLPAHRGEELTDEIFERHADEIFEQAENRLHIQKAIMVRLMGGIQVAEG